MPEVGDGLYLTLKLLHLLGVVLYLGGLVVGAYWKATADRSGDPPHAARVHRRLRAMDKHLVGPGALLTFAAGYVMIRGFGSRIAERPFALWGLIVMFVSLAIWYFAMRRLADRLIVEAESAAASRQPLGAAYARLSAGWILASLAAILLVVAVAVMMVFKLPGP
ncbi:MAG TPA: DUF2269 family protein [Candidatus Thermoplasmatota archaeon]|nr:DUF2269 family protein [Candidatus Thermoplasmatota archaeon]